MSTYYEKYRDETGEIRLRRKAGGASKDGDYLKSFGSRPLRRVRTATRDDYFTANGSDLIITYPDAAPVTEERPVLVGATAEDVSCDQCEYRRPNSPTATKNLAAHIKRVHSA